MPNCAAFGCKSIAKKGDGLSFHSFPSDDEPLRQKQWVLYCKRQNFVKPTKYSKLCSKHFSKDCFERDLEKMRLYGYENALPTLKADAIPDMPLLLPRPKSQCISIIVEQDIEATDMEVLQDGQDGPSTSAVDDTNILITLAVSLDQEMAIKTFFQVNEWPLIEGEKHLEMADKDSGTRLMTLRVTPEQETAMEAFFQINNWALIKEAETAVSTVTEILENVEETISDDSSVIPAGTTFEEVTVNADDMEIQVSSDGSGKQQQVIFYKNGKAHLLPSILLAGGGKNLGSQIVVQEISLPEARNLENLVIANTNPIPKLPRKVTPRGSMKPGDKVHKCHVCGKTFKQSQSFNGHYQTHFGNKPHKCSICGTGFTLKAALVAHQSIHTGEKPFQCSVCLKRFRRKDDLVSHIRTHTGEKPYECEICGKAFKYRNQIPKHMRGHTGEKPYKCTHCEKAFTSNIHLKRHERTHTGERPYKCEFCTKAFTQYGHLQAHIRIHTNERPYKCSICSRGFREKKVLKKHESLHTSERPYKCEVCGKGFLRQSNMELHSVMHQKGRDGTPKVRPRPKKKKTADAAMVDFVSRVLTSVEKVETGMQTENFSDSNNKMENTTASDNLAAFVDFAVSKHELQQPGIGDGDVIYQDPNVQTDTIPDNLGNQYTLVLPEDGSEGYLIAVDQQEQIVSTEPEIQNMPTAEELNKQVVNATQVYNNLTKVGEMVTGLVSEAVHNVTNDLGETDNEAISQSSILAGDVDNKDHVNLTNLENVNLENTSLTTCKTEEMGESQEFSTLDWSALNPDASTSGVDNQDGAESQIYSETGQIHIVK